MNIGPISLNGNVQSIIASALQGIGGTSSNNTAALSASTGVQTTDQSRLSPFAQILSKLQQLQQSDPAQYKEVTQQIATNLQSAAQTATGQGNTASATQLNQLSKDFTDASTSGQLPNIQDLAQAVRGAGGHHGHHHHAAPAGDTDGGGTNATTSSASSSSTGNTTIDQLLASLQAQNAGSSTTNPLGIILQTLNDAGLGSSTSTSTSAVSPS